ncbi:MAG: T9SS type A sorting domain-containing protein [bacterium]|nr:T9SS type A sorting domain-containing protein [bacterium]
MKRALLILLCTLSALAQWPTDPSQNLLICDHTGEQALPKTAATSDGGCYIAWQDLSSGNYDIYLQLLDENGVPQWDNPCGLLISDHPQDTWLTDWDIAVDLADNCILAINDIRNGADRDITAYSISRWQEFIWGDDGLAISDNDGFEPDPRILPMDNGDVVFAWQEETSIHVRKLDSLGNDVFNPPLITFTQANGVSIPRLASLDNTGFALSYLAQQGTQFTSPRHLYVRAYNDDASNRWAEAGVPIMTQNGIGIQMRPDLVNDGNGGVYVYWYDARGNVHHCYAQHIENDGAAHWTVNGLQVDLSANELQMSPSAVSTESGLALFYQTANPNQTQGGVQAQMLDWMGNYVWDSNGITVAALSTEPCFNVRAFKQEFAYAVSYSQYAPGSATSTILRASQLSAMGEFTWTPPITDLCTVVSEKGRPYACNNNLNQMIVTWPDARDGDMNLYVQNVNYDGALGPMLTQPPTIEIISPADNDSFNTSAIEVEFDVEDFDLTEMTGDGAVILQVNGMHVDTLHSESPIAVDILPGQNEIVAFLVDQEYHALVPAVSDQITVHYNLPPPTIQITDPTRDTLVFNSPITIRFEVENFIFPDSLGTNHVRLISTPDPPETPTIIDLFSADPVDVPLVFLHDHMIVLMIIRNQIPEDPLAVDTVMVTYGEISADPRPDVLPTSFAISSTYPNPFNSTLVIGYDVPIESNITAGVYDLLGRQVTTLLDGTRSAGRHVVQWQANNAAAGVYFVRLVAPNAALTQKVLLLK